MLDIDHFKKINDTYGHPRGDLVLQSVSSKLASLTRKSDVVARYGGEEFAVIAPETDLNAAMILAERCRQAIEQMNIPVGDHSVKTTVSVGVTCSPNEMQGISKGQIVDAADKALYNSKKTGRNKVSFVKMTKSAPCCLGRNS